MGMDPVAFRKRFTESFLENSNLMDQILNLAIFQSLYHNVYDKCNKCGDECNASECSYCYSGDTEFEMTHDTLNLKRIYEEVSSKIPKIIDEEESDAEESPTETDDSSCVGELVNDLDVRYLSLKSTNSSSSSSLSDLSYSDD
jgi:hypothetical protein